jgi:hypothetical protein
MKKTAACVLAACLLAGGCQTQADAERTVFIWRYAAWRDEAKRIAHSSRTGDYLALPSFRAIEGMGPAAVPLIQSLLEDGKCERAPDFFLAHAVLEIRGWSEKEFAPEPASEQALCRKVLERLGA